MSEFAPVGSVHHYEKMEEAGVLGDYHLLLAHQVLDEPQRWQELYGAIRSKGRDPFIIMDNSLVELGSALPTDYLLRAREIVGASVIVLADTLRDARATVASSFRMAMEILEEDRSVGMLAVIQGRTTDEAIACVKALGNQSFVKMLSVPRVMTEQFGSRKSMVHAVQSVAPGKPIHLLGFSDDQVDDLESARMEGVKGIDSAVPIRQGLDGKLWEFNKYEIPGKRDPQYLWDDRWDTKVVYNVERYREALKHGV